MHNVILILPNAIQDRFKHFSDDQLKAIEEIRIRMNRPIEITANQKTSYLSYIVQSEDIEQILNKIGNHSIYTLEEELKRGYITIEGGHRIGLAGKVILENGKVKAIRHVASFNIRIAKEKIGIAKKWLPYLYQSGWKNTIIIGPPQTGKQHYYVILRELYQPESKS